MARVSADANDLLQKDIICYPDNVKKGLCKQDQLGQYLLQSNATALARSAIVLKGNQLEESRSSHQLPDQEDWFLLCLDLRLLGRRVQCGGHFPESLRRASGCSDRKVTILRWLDDRLRGHWSVGHEPSFQIFLLIRSGFGRFCTFRTGKTFVSSVPIRWSKPY